MSMDMEAPGRPGPGADPAEVQDAIRRARELGGGKDYANKRLLAAALAEIWGHPLHTLRAENEALAERIRALRETLDAGEEPGPALARVRELAVHYAKKGDLLYPLLKARYAIAGPSDLMWTEDDEIRDELTALQRSAQRGPNWEAQLRSALDRAEGMIRKERDILFPMCAVNFTEAEWRGIYRDSLDYDECLGVARETWPEAEAQVQTEAASAEGAGGEVVLAGGHMSPAQLEALLDTIPMEISFVDAQDRNRFFNGGHKVFKRPAMALDREVYSCHPPKVEAMVRRILEDFRAGRRDRVPMWTEKGGRTMLVTYLAVRDRSGQYLGTVELVQDMEFAKEHFLG